MKEAENLTGVFESGGKIFKDKVECFGIYCNLKGDIIETLYDGLNIHDYIITKKSFLNLVDEGSIEKANEFLKKIRNDSAAFDWELDVLSEHKIKVIHFSGFLVEDKFLIFGAISVYEMIRFKEMLNNLNNTQATALSHVMKDFDLHLPEQKVKDNELFEEIGRLNHELNNAKRELTKNNTEQRKLIEQLKNQTALLKEREADLERSNNELKQFSYVAAHDLREPLRMVSSFSQLLERRYKDRLDDDANEFIEFIVDGALRMNNLIDDLLTY